MQLIPLTELTLSQTHNVRKTNRAHKVGELVASIAAHGLLENLLVIRVGDVYEVIAGGRRLSALQQLHEEGRIPEDYAVPCEVVSAADAHEISLAENTVREAMHPADQFEAWARLVGEGLSTCDIAERFGVREELVRQRLKLGRVSPRILQAYRDEDISLEVVMAYTLADDHEKQEAVYERVQESWEVNSADAVRRRLTEHAVSGSDARARLVGVEDYIAAGGTLRHDLFEDDCYFEDAELLDRLVTERLEAVAEQLRLHWAWVEVWPAAPYEELSRFRRLYPHPLGEPPEELTARFSELSEQMEQLLEEDPDHPDVPELEQEFAQLERQLESYHGFSEDERAVAGCVVTLGHRGAHVYEGLVRPGQKLPAREGETDDPSGSTKPRYSERVAERLQNYRLHAMRLAVAADFPAAFDMLVYALSCREFSHGACPWLGAATNTYHYPFTLRDDESLASMKVIEETQRSQLPLAWLNEEDVARRFLAFCELSNSDKQRLFAACVANSLRPQLVGAANSHPEFEAIADRLQVDVAAHWRPSADNFFSRLPKAELLSIGRELWGESWTHTYQGSKKDRLVTALHNAFANPSGPEAGRVARWLPPGLASCSVVEPGDDESAGSQLRQEAA